MPWGVGTRHYRTGLTPVARGLCPQGAAALAAEASGAELLRVSWEDDADDADDAGLDGDGGEDEFAVSTLLCIVSRTALHLQPST